MLSRKRTTMAELEPGAKKEFDIDPSPKQARRCDENGTVIKFVQEFPKIKERKQLQPSQGVPLSIPFMHPSSTSAAMEGNENEMEVDDGNINESQQYADVGSFNEEMTDTQEEFDCYMQYKPNKKRHNYDFMMDESN